MTYILTLTTLISWTGLLLAQFQLFNLCSLFSIVFLFAFILRIFFKEEFPSFKLKIHFSKHTLFLTLILLASALFYLKPHEYITGHWDPGVYLNTGYHIAQHGSIEITDPLLSQMTSEEMKIFVDPKPGTPLYPGFYLKNALDGTFIPQFYHVYPVWISIFFKIFGAHGALFVNFVFSLLALWTWALLVEEISNRRVAFMATILLGLSIPQIWITRFPASEILSQYFIFSVLYTFLKFEKEKKKFWGVLAGLSLGAALLTRPTGILLLPNLAFHLAFRERPKLKRSDLSWATPLALASLHLVLQGYFFTKYYLHEISHFFILNLQERKIILLGTLTLSTFFLFHLIWRKTKWKYSVGTLAKWLLATILLSLGIYAYFIRPRSGYGPDDPNLICLSWFMGPPSIILAIFGITAWSDQELKRKNLFVFSSFLSECLFFLYKKSILSTYPWALKRFVPLVVPSIAIFAAYALEKMTRKIPRARGLILSGLCGLLILPPLVKGHAFLRESDQKGMISFLTELAQKLDPEGIYLLERDFLAVPLQHLCELKTLVLPEPSKFPEVEPVLIRWIREGQHLYYLGHPEKPYSEKLQFERAQIQLPQLNTSLLEPSYMSYPKKIKKIQIAPSLYKISELTSAIEKEKDFWIDIGEERIGLLNGFDRAKRFKEKEKKSFFWARWTTGKASLILPCFNSQIPQELILHISGFRGKTSPSNQDEISRLSLWVNDTLLAKDIALPNDFTTLRLPIPEKLLDRKEGRCILTLESNVWKPSEKGIKGFPYQLGVLLDWIKIRKSLHPQDDLRKP
ncbi:MAG: glycosyltransferase family 39 protein [Chlamydiae bacterium]|nr:glycosyltransferase family 39 protein [Chlamydiota bacterium]MBI3266859.1 glycosyltransferase family 39 protein [Chlamydiota bacterium]